MFFFSLFDLCFNKFIKILRDDNTPPNTPRRARIAAQRDERDERTMDSPQRRRIPSRISPPVIQTLTSHCPVQVQSYVKDNNLFDFKQI